MGKLVSIIETSRRFGVSEATVRNWIDKKFINVKRIGKARYIDEDTIFALQDTAEEIARQKSALEKIAEESRNEKELQRDWLTDEKNRRRYTNIIVRAGMRTGFYETITQLLGICGILNTREKIFLTEYLSGKTIGEIAEKFGLTRERGRQVIEKAIRKSRELESIKERIERIEELEKENERLKEQNRILSEHIKQYDKDNGKETPTEVEVSESDTLIGLLNTKIIDCPLSIRALNCLKAGYTKHEFSFGRSHTKVVVPECKTVGDLCRLTTEQFLMIRNAGKKTLIEIDNFLKSKGLSWGMDVDGIFEEHKRLIAYK